MKNSKTNTTTHAINEFHCITRPRKHKKNNRYNTWICIDSCIQSSL